MKISETSGRKFAVVTGYECRLTKRNYNSNYGVDTYEKNELNCWVINDGILRNENGEAILIPHRVEYIKKRMMKLGYKDFDFDSKPYALVMCYK